MRLSAMITAALFALSPAAFATETTPDDGIHSNAGAVSPDGDVSGDIDDPSLGGNADIDDPDFGGEPADIDDPSFGGEGDDIDSI